MNQSYKSIDCNCSRYHLNVCTHHNIMMLNDNTEHRKLHFINACRNAARGRTCGCSLVVPNALLTKRSQVQPLMVSTVVG